MVAVAEDAVTSGDGTGKPYRRHGGIDTVTTEPYHLGTGDDLAQQLCQLHLVWGREREYVTLGEVHCDGPVPNEDGSESACPINVVVTIGVFHYLSFPTADELRINPVDEP
jgi:hypothetical protein